LSKLRDLFIVDTSAFIHTGSVNKVACLEDEIVKTAKGWVTPSIPTGGVAFMFNCILDFAHKGDIIFAADRTPTVKRAIYPDYKMTRIHKPEVTVQKEIAEAILQDCGFQVVYEDGYEADDCIYTLCEKYKHIYRNVFVFSDDSDMAIVVDDNSHMLPVRQSGKIVTKENYSTTIKKDTITPYSALSFLKVVHGDPKDNVRALPKDVQKQLMRFFWNETHFPFMRNRDFMRAMIEDVEPRALQQFEVIYPHIVETATHGLDFFSRPNMTRALEWGSLVGNNRCRPTTKRIPEDMKIKVKSFFDNGMALDFD